MRPKSLHRPGLAAILCAFLAAGCAPTVQVHGYVPPQADIARIRPGVDDTATVQKILGQPSSAGVLRDSAWYYVQSTVENYTYHAPRVVDRTVLSQPSRPASSSTRPKRAPPSPGNSAPSAE